MNEALGSDRDLLERFQQGDREAFTAVYRAHHTAIFRFALHMTGDRVKASEITQDVFVWLVHHPGAFDPQRGDLAVFLMGVARKLLLRRQYHERRWLPFEDEVVYAVLTNDQVDPVADLGRSIDAAALRKAIALLPNRYREALCLCDLENKSYEEAARYAGCAVGTIRSRLHRARELLARKFLPLKNSGGRP